MSKNDRKGGSHVIGSRNDIMKAVDEMNKRATSFERFTLVVNEETLMKCVANLKQFLFCPFEQYDNKKNSDDERNMFSLQEKYAIDSDDAFKNVFYVMMKLIRLHEKSSFEFPSQQQQRHGFGQHSGGSAYMSVSDKVIEELVSQVQVYQKCLYEHNNGEKLYYYEKCILVYLFIIHYIIKNYPLFISKRETLQKCFLKLKSFKK